MKPALLKPIADMCALAEGESRTRMTPVTDQTRESETLHVARQPILDERGRVFGYELLYRRAARDGGVPHVRFSDRHVEETSTAAPRASGKVC